jgi:ketosteroid isomerase-like protein
MTAEALTAEALTAEALTAEVLSAAAALVEAFGAHDVGRYFECFAEDASFLFHTSDHVLTSRDAYAHEWSAWEQDGFRVLGCRSLEPRVQLLTDETAVFTHRVRTRVAREDRELWERETIVFHRDKAGRWLGVHEHLSADPQDSEARQP